MSRLANQAGRRMSRSKKLTNRATLLRVPTASRDVHGRWQAGTPTEHPVRVARVPYRYKGIQGQGTRRMEAPEGVRESDVSYFYLYHTADINTVEPGENTGDILRYMGTEFRVCAVLDWDGYSEVLGVKPEALPGA